MPLTPHDRIPLLWDREAEFAANLDGRRPALFLDYDGTLSPLVDNPGEAAIPPATRRALMRFVGRVPVVLVSGRDRLLLEHLADLEGVVYAGSHGYDISGPGITHVEGEAFSRALDDAWASLSTALADIPCARLERKRFAIAAHTRTCTEAEAAIVVQAVEMAAGSGELLRIGRGKRVYELRPAFDWHKGRAVEWLVGALELTADRWVPIFIGDDLTDEDGFRVVEASGIGIVVDDLSTAEAMVASSARYRLADPADVGRFLGYLADRCGLPPG